MKQLSLYACFVIALTMLFGSAVIAQNVSFNGDFETGSHSHGWTLVGGNTYTTMATFTTSINADPSWTVKRRPGAPDNGGIEQEVHLIGGETYLFSANVAAQYCSS